MSQQMTVYKRSSLKNAFRWLAFGAIVFLDVTCIAQTISYFATHAVTASMIAKQSFMYLIMFFLNCAILPAVVMEARKVEVLDDKLVIHNLLYTTTIPWTDVRKVSNPIWLKFAIIRTPRFFALINKRDVEGFSDLIQIIREKAEEAPKVVN
jgi:hypothetical protein